MITPLATSNLILRRDAARWGFSGADIRRSMARGDLVRVRRGGYLDASTAQALDEVTMHAVLVRAGLHMQRDPGVVSHVSAAVLHGLPVWAIDLSLVHLTKRRRNSGRNDPIIHIHTTALGDGDVVILNGVEVTSPTRTILDLACTLPFEQAVIVADAALHHQLSTREALSDSIARARGRHGLSRAGLVVGFADGGSESVGESRSRVGMNRAGLPAPALQRVIRRSNGDVVGRSDFDWDGLLGEFDGMVKYGRLRLDGETAGDAVAREKRREDDLRDLGHGMVRWTWAELGRPADLYARIGLRIQRFRTLWS